MLLHKRTHQCALVPVVWCLHMCGAHNMHFVPVPASVVVVMHGPLHFLPCHLVHLMHVLYSSSCHNLPCESSAPVVVQVSAMVCCGCACQVQIASAWNTFRLGLPWLSFEFVCRAHVGALTRVCWGGVGPVESRCTRVITQISNQIMHHPTGRFR